ncbi:hypothetical protein CBS63078_9653 [Aspergillus niger]|nr:hypothetical protein CBS11852_8072 [Aspergillus niger]KAI2891019.1 hypothetical protein CBS13152_5286 [Aspergillus niger]KAI2891521.1 hypothetical protein CBS63078_9653 [Aspergillus niger]KAI2956612.1 hypothetical protein CBS147323_9224 [Aspergillus niger]KAI3014805.1 hypothetical protein CBS147345_5194 [Aspergillus niger]
MSEPKPEPELPHRRLSQPPELDDPITSGWAPLGFCRKRVGGFRNRGTLCYRNAVLVVLMNTPVFLKWLIRYHKSHETCTSEQQKCLTCCFYRLYHLYWVKEDDGKDRLQRCLKPLWGRLAKTSWNGYTQGQQDARAFLECIFQQLLVEVDEQGCRELNDIFKIRTIHLKGRRLNWKVNDQLVISEGDGPLIWLKPGKKVQHAEVRLRLVCQKTREVLTGRGIIPLKPEILLEPYDAGPRPDTSVRDVGTQTRLSFRGEDNRQVRPSGSAQDRVISGKIIKASSPKRSQLATRASI